ncbi:hypothetical protein AB6A40_001137 [Gnathostoma spinigerum]|uniref:Zinc finger ZPR1-type domain-containing protein n=1 Tax=Gnathostoma spinigerum TaxID=75299 RepID=A0ABD6EC92_9BILA
MELSFSPGISCIECEIPIKNSAISSICEEMATASATNPGEDIFTDLSGDSDANQPTEIESMCMNCHKNGITRLLLTKIPYYRQVIVMSFSCDHCGYKNAELQSGEPIQDFGLEIVLRVLDSVDLNRQVIKSEYSEIEIPELDLTIPARSQSGEITTVEGVLQRIRDGLTQDQAKRMREDPENASKIADVIHRIEDLLKLKSVFTLKLKDASGNCFIENPNPLHVDPRCITNRYVRSVEERKMLGLLPDDFCDVDGPTSEWKSYEDAKNEVLRFPTNCPACGAPVETCMKPTDIPYFSTVIIMSTVCEKCGHRTNEVKSGNSVRDRGCKLVLSIEEVIDFSRDVLKSDTCMLSIPEVGLDVGAGALCGRFTTVEGIIMSMRDQLKNEGRFLLGDSASNEESDKFANFLREFDDILSLKRKVHLILDDPAGNSYIQSLAAPLDDPRLSREFYIRSYEQNDELGLNDMKTENYGELETVNEEDDEGNSDL